MRVHEHTSKLKQKQRTNNRKPSLGLFRLSMVLIFMLLLSIVLAVKTQWAWYVQSVVTTSAGLSVILIWEPEVIASFNVSVDLKAICMAVVVAYLAQNTILLIWRRNPSVFVYERFDLKLFLFLAIAGPLVEEVFARGIMTASLLDRLPTWMAASVSVILMTLVHIVGGPALVIQLTLTILFVASGRKLVSTIAGHFVINGLLFVPQLTFVHWLK